MKHSDYCRCGAIVDLNAIRHNLSELKRAAGNKKILSVMKANAYGHGSCEAANAINDMSDMFATATIDEGVHLRVAGGITKPILILGPTFTGEDDQVILYGLTETVFDLDRARALNESVNEFVTDNLDKLKEMQYTSPDYKAHIHIAVDTGMSRIGLTPDENGAEIIKKISELGNIVIDGIFTHFATADASDKTYALEAYNKFRNFKKLCVESGISIPIWHCANTASIIDGIGLDDDMDMVRCGVGLYGMYPSEEVSHTNVNLAPAMLWYSYVTRIKELEPGTSVSYGYTFTADKKMKIGTVCCGYADGYPRLLSNKGSVLIGGKRCRILGNICMDQFMVDLTGVDNVSVGAPVVLLGSDGVNTVSAEDIADICQTISYEVVCGISSRVPRKYV
ncbi:MAG: alanine racemase [Lachnospiraceae bacterium]|nr:alanine racemase [Lachnospiraceae bacterium]